MEVFTYVMLGIAIGGCATAVGLWLAIVTATTYR